MSAMPLTADIDLVQLCLEGESEAIKLLRSRYNQPVRNFLIASGASPNEAADVVEHMWTDCIMPRGERPPLFTRYKAQNRLEAWLKTVALNALIDRKRRESKLVEIDSGLSAGMKTAVTGIATEPQLPGSGAEAHLLEIMRDALKQAIARRQAAEVVMLHLHHVNGLTQRELAGLWRWHEAKVSRLLSSAMAGIAHDTMRFVRKADPWIELKWDDFMELCSTADFSLFRD